MTAEFQTWYRRRKRGILAQIALNAVVCVIIVWIIVGLLYRVGVLPNLDLGYSWFNRAVFRLF